MTACAGARDVGEENRRRDQDGSRLDEWCALLLAYRVAGMTVRGGESSSFPLRIGDFVG
jgi:hypothetical protein